MLIRQSSEVRCVLGREPIDFGGEWKLAAKTTMQDIADSLSISKVTVSNALRHKKGVSAEMKQTILQRAEEMGYSNVVAQLDFTVGLLIPSRNMFGGDFAFYSKIVDKISGFCRQDTINTRVFSLSDDEEKNLQLPDLKGISLLVIIAHISDQYFQRLTELKIPKVMVDSYKSPLLVDSVFYDNFLHGYQLTTYLIRRGHRRIGYIGDIYSSASRMDRFLGVQKALMENRIAFDPGCHLQENLHEFFYNRELVLPSPLPTAFVCHSDKAAYILLMYFKSMKIEVPRDVSVVAFDNIDITKEENFLTTIDINTKRLAERTVRRIVWRLENPGAPIHVDTLHGEIIERFSVGEPREQ